MKETLNLLQTTFPMRADLPQREPQILQKWEQDHLYQKIRLARRGAPIFRLTDGPPFSNGPIHLGHAVNKILKDFILKSKSLEGFDTPFVPGWDCHGLPIEVQVEKKLGSKVEPAEFRRHCREYAHSQIAIQMDGFKRLGVLADWDHPYRTMDYQYEAQTIRHLATVCEKGLLIPGHKPVHWCTYCQSSLAEAETEFTTQVAATLDVWFQSTKSWTYQGQTYPLHVPIWTTTPWTLPSNQAVVYHPSDRYVAVIKDSVCYPLHEARVEECFKKWGWDQSACQILPFDTAFFDGLQLKHLFQNDQTVPMIASELVTADKGTGFVHNAPDHGPEDYDIAHSMGIKPLGYLNANGYFTEKVGSWLAGRSWKESEVIVKETLTLKGQVICAEPYEHQALVCWRHKTPIFYRATEQWFITMSPEMKDQLDHAINSVKWYPESGAGRISHMVQNRPDWCLSRQRFWGAPLVLVYHPETREFHPQMKQIAEAVASAVEKNGIEAWFSSTLADWGVDPLEGWVKSSDTVDVWFESGCAFYTERRNDLQQHVVADVYLEGTDQYRGWFQSSLICSVIASDQAPYRTVLTHGFLVDGQGKKMSKSLGNVVSPHELCEKYGIDIVRLWVSMTNYDEEMAISHTILDRVADGYRRIRNTMKFLLANLVDFQLEHAIASDQLPLLDRWIINQVSDLQKEAINAYDQFQFHHVARGVIDFCVNDLGATYLDIVKDRLYTAQANSHARRSAQTACYYVFQSLLHQILPILPFTAEEIWSHFTLKDHQESVLLNTWPQMLQVSWSHHDAEHMAALWALRKEVHLALEEARRSEFIGSSLEAVLQLNRSCDDFAQWGHELKFIFLVSDVQIGDFEEKIQILRSEFEKCPRCWHRVLKENQTVCDRCEENLHGEGEARKYA